MSATGGYFAGGRFASLNAEWVERHAYETHAAAASIAQYIDGFYDRAKGTLTQAGSADPVRMRSHLAAVAA